MCWLIKRKVQIRISGQASKVTTTKIILRRFPLTPLAFKINAHNMSGVKSKVIILTTLVRYSSHMAIRYSVHNLFVSTTLICYTLHNGDFQTTTQLHKRLTELLLTVFCFILLFYSSHICSQKNFLVTKTFSSRLLENAIATTVLLSTFTYLCFSCACCCRFI